MDGIEHIISGILITAFIAYSNKQSSYKVKRNEEGFYHLMLNNSYKWFGIITILGSFIVFIGLLFSDEEGMVSLALVMLGTFGGLGIIILMCYYNHHLIFNDELITVKSWRGIVKTTSWDEISNIKYSPMLGYLIIYSETDKLNIHFHLVGLSEFVKLMESKTDYKAKDLKLPF